MRSTYKDSRSFIFRGWSAARLAGEHPPKSAPIVFYQCFFTFILALFFGVYEPIGRDFYTLRDWKYAPDY